MTAIAPEHLASMKAICEKFKKSRRTVKDWHKDGAPIVFDGVTYSAEYNKLQDWLFYYYQDRKIQLQQAKVRG